MLSLSTQIRHPRKGDNTKYFVPLCFSEDVVFDSNESQPFQLGVGIDVDDQESQSFQLFDDINEAVEFNRSQTRKVLWASGQWIHSFDIDAGGQYPLC